MKRLRLILLMLTLLPLTACGLSSEPIKGQVLEAGTNKPIGGAIVIARWEKTQSISIADSRTYCAHVESTVTDDKGGFVLPRWRGDAPLYLDAYKPGYERSKEYFTKQSWKQNIDLLEPFKGTSGERLEYLMRQRGKECGLRDDYVKKLIPLYRALYEEAKGIALTPEDMKVVNSLHYSIDDLELGTDETNKRQAKGVYGQ